jgi:hypothetical protein
MSSAVDTSSDPSTVIATAMRVWWPRACGASWIGGVGTLAV